MAKAKTVYVCQSCAYETSSWQGQCPNCHTWNSFEEVVVQSTSKSSVSSGSRRSTNAVSTVKLSDVKVNKKIRIGSNISEFDRVLGGGFVPGQVIIIAGEPGIGKSTLLTQVAKEMHNKKILYVCGEESMSQIKIRTQRMGYSAENLVMLSETAVYDISSVIEMEKPDLVIVDSIQTIFSPDLTGIPGSIGQVRTCTQVLTNTAKANSIPMILVGHITKTGSVAGPKVLEHIVDTVLYLEGDSQHLFRILKTTKNRFGPVSEVGIFEISDQGMVEVKNPSKLFLGQRQSKSSGSCITVVMEGYRPILYEIQALTSRTAFGYPRRTASGFSVNRLQVLIAILEKRCGLDLSGHDVYVNVAGGLKVDEFAVDLAVCLAIASSLKDTPIDPKTAVFGECGLSGEIRKVTHEDKRLNEAKKMGFDTIICSGSVKSLQQAVGKVLGFGKKPATRKPKTN